MEVDIDRSVPACARMRTRTGERIHSSTGMRPQRRGADFGLGVSVGAEPAGHRCCPVRIAWCMLDAARCAANRYAACCTVCAPLRVAAIALVGIARANARAQLGVQGRLLLCAVYRIRHAALTGLERISEEEVSGAGGTGDGIGGEFTSRSAFAPERVYHAYPLCAIGMPLRHASFTCCRTRTRLPQQHSRWRWHSPTLVRRHARLMYAGMRPATTIAVADCCRRRSVLNSRLKRFRFR